MTPYECYCDYIAIKTHFNTVKFDYTKYAGKQKISTSYDTFTKRRDTIFFEKLSRQPDPHKLLLANFMMKQKPFVGDIVSEEGKKIYEQWNKNQQSLSYVIRNDLSKLDEPFSKNFETDECSHPNLIKLYLGNEISLETLVVLAHTFKAIKGWDKKMKDDFIWKEISMKVKKAKSFINIDEDKICKMVLDIFADLEYTK